MPGISRERPLEPGQERARGRAAAAPREPADARETGWISRPPTASMQVVAEALDLQRELDQASEWSFAISIALW